MDWGRCHFLSSMFESMVSVTIVGVPPVIADAESTDIMLIPEPGGILPPGSCGPDSDFPCYEPPWTLSTGSSNGSLAPNGDYEYATFPTQQDCQAMLQQKLSQGIRAYCQYHGAPANNWTVNFAVNP